MHAPLNATVGTVNLRPMPESDVYQSATAVGVTYVPSVPTTLHKLPVVGVMVGDFAILANGKKALIVVVLETHPRPHK